MTANQRLAQRLAEQFPRVILDADPVWGDTKTGVVASANLPMHTGNPLREQEQLLAGTAVTLLPLGVVAVSGPDRHEWLTLLTSQKLDQLHPGVWQHALILDPQGHVSFELWAADAPTEASNRGTCAPNNAANADNEPATVGSANAIWLLTTDAQSLTEFLGRMRFRSQVEVTDLSDRLVTLGYLRGDQPHELPGALVAGADTWPTVAQGGTFYTNTADNHPGLDARAHYAIFSEDTADALLQNALAEIAADPENLAPCDENQPTNLAGTRAWQALRVARWQPSYPEIDGKTLPHELDWLRDSVHLHKGCYCGQETVARIINVGKPPRRLVFLHLDGSANLPAPGDSITSGDQPVGTITTIAEHYEDGPTALGLLKRTTPVEAPLQAGGCALAATPIVNPDGRADASPAQRPGAGQTGWVRRPEGRQRL